MSKFGYIIAGLFVFWAMFHTLYLFGQPARDIKSAISEVAENANSRVVVSDQVQNNGITFRYTLDTATGICSVVISNGEAGKPQVIDCTPEVMRLFSATD